TAPVAILAGVPAAMAVAYLALLRWTPLPARPAALVVGALACAAYLLFALLGRPGIDVAAAHLAVYLVSAYLMGLIGAHRERLRARSEARAGFHWAPAAIVAFLVAVVSADALLILIAERGLPPGLAERVLPAGADARRVSSGFPGVVYRDYQEKEQRYNEHLRRLERQRARGWQVRKGWRDAPVAGAAAAFEVRVADRDGRPVSGAEVRGRFLRPADSRLDRAFEMDETAPGAYRAHVRLPRPGLWRLVLVIERGKDRHELIGATTVGEGP
ncbi:MAG: nitrogen fixation protein FixH, partial [Gammaproteobacteria bacterium]|nr:nitrogen fixation protein FixH [Gammaproteobacteria bacterium]